MKSSPSSFSGFSSPSDMPIPVMKMQSSSCNNAVAKIKASSNVCTTTFVMTLLVVSVKSYIFPKLISDSVDLCRKRKECSGSLSYLSHDEIWAEFQSFLASCSAAGHTSSLSSSQSLGSSLRSPANCSKLSSFSPLWAHLPLSKRDQPATPACLTQHASPAQWGVWETSFSPDGSGDNVPNW